MAGEARASESVSSPGPGNRVIAATLLEWLAARGRGDDYERARRALDLEAGGERALPIWLPAGSLAAMFAAARIEPSFARALGHRLAAPDLCGLQLYRLGLATPEKGYRRIAALLPREDATAAWQVVSIDVGQARIAWAPAPGAADRETNGERAAGGDANRPDPRVEATLCALRRGMLEAIPGLYGLLPAHIDEKTCRARGSDRCRYTVQWQSGRRRGRAIGGALGIALGLVVGFVLLPGVDVVAPADPTGWPSVLGGAGGLGAVGVVVTGLLGGAIGWVSDLRAQLAAVAGARRGQLALFDQVDEALAARLDALARADAKLEDDASSGAAATRARSAVELAGQTRREIRGAAVDIHSAAGELECWLDAPARGDGEASSSPARACDDERVRVREIRACAARIAELVDAGVDHALESNGRTVDLAALARRAVASVRPTLAPSLAIELDCAPDLPPLRCDRIRIEQVVVQLIENAAEATATEAGSGVIRVSLAPASTGIELAVEDEGCGIDSTDVDEVFDPFFAAPGADASARRGLPGCLAIVEAHGGALRIEAEGRTGTRVSLLLPTAPEAGAGPGDRADEGPRERARKGKRNGRRRRGRRREARKEGNNRRAR